MLDIKGRKCTCEGGYEQMSLWEIEREKINLDVLLPQNILVINETLEFVFIGFIKISSS